MSETTDVRLARMEERFAALEVSQNETRKAVYAIRELLDTQAPRWATLSERVNTLNRVLWAIALPALAGLGAGAWSMAHIAK